MSHPTSDRLQLCHIKSLFSRPHWTGALRFVLCVSSMRVNVGNSCHQAPQGHNTALIPKKYTPLDSPPHSSHVISFPASEKASASGRRRRQRHLAILSIRRLFYAAGSALDPFSSNQADGEHFTSTLCLWPYLIKGGICGSVLASWLVVVNWMNVCVGKDCRVLRSFVPPAHQYFAP